MKNSQYFIGVDGHKKYLVATVVDKDGKLIEQAKIYYTDEEAFNNFFSKYQGIATAAVEAYGYWYWLLDKLEELDLSPVLSNPIQTKAIASARVKTDKVDSRIIAHLLRTDFLPTCWVPPGDIRDKRELCRSRIYLVRIQTKLKNKIHSFLAKYNIQTNFSDLFGKKGMDFLKNNVSFPHPETNEIFKMLLSCLEDINTKIKKIEKRILEIHKITHEIKLIDSVPGIGKVLAITIWYETGDIKRFPKPKKYIGYCGLASCVRSTGGKVVLGPTPKECNHWLKYAFVEAAWAAIRTKNTRFKPIYTKFLQRKGSEKAIVAVARRMAQCVYYMLRNNQYYMEDYNAPQDKQKLERFNASANTYD